MLKVYFDLICCCCLFQPDTEQHSDSSYQAMTELRVKLRKAEDMVASLTQDKADLVSNTHTFVAYKQGLN